MLTLTADKIHLSAAVACLCYRLIPTRLSVSFAILDTSFAKIDVMPLDKYVVSHLKDDYS